MATAVTTHASGGSSDRAIIGGTTSTTSNFMTKALVPLAGWLVLVPLALLALLRTPLEAGLAAALVGGMASASTVWSRTLRQLFR